MHQLKCDLISIYPYKSPNDRMIANNYDYFIQNQIIAHENQMKNAQTSNAQCDVA